MKKSVEMSIVWAAFLAALTLLSACAAPGSSVVILEEERCTRYGGLWVAGPGHCSHNSSVGR